MAKNVAFSLLSLCLSSLSNAAPLAASEQQQPRSSSSVHHAPTVNLVPSVHWSHDLHDHNYLVPAKHSLLYYTDPAGKSDKNGKQDSAKQHSFATMNVTFTSPAVVLEHSAYISSIRCASDKILVTVSDDAAFALAKQHWDSKGTIFETYAASCGDSNGDATRTYWKANGAEFSAKSSGGGLVKIDATKMSTKDGLSSIKLEWGVHKPSTADATGHSKRSKPAKAPSCQPPKSGSGSLATADWCEANFDQTLDKEIGFTKLSESSFLPKLEKVAQGIKGAVTSPAKRDCIDSCDESFSFTPSIDLTLDSNANSPWGPAYQLLDDSSASKREASGLTGEVDLYCVDCHATGAVTISGGMHIQVIPDIVCPDPFPWDCYTATPEGVSGLWVNAAGSLDAALNVGLVADGGYAKTEELALLNIPLDPWSIPDIVSLGPVATLDAKLDLNITAKGQFLAGAGMSIGPFNAHYDVDSSTGTSSGFDVTTKTTFEPKGEISLDATLTFPIGLGFGFDVMVVDYQKDISLKDGVGIEVTADYVSANTATKGTKCPGGVEWGISVVEQVFFDFLDGTAIFYLYNWQSPILASGCSGGSTPPPKKSTGVIKLGEASGQGVLASPDGNFYSAANLGSSTTFTTSQGTVISDSKDRFFHYYKDEMAKDGVSRMRLSTLSQVPKTAEMIVLEPVHTNGAEKYVAVDSKGGIYYPVVCTIAKQNPKIFLEERTNGYSKLLSSDLIWSVTGGQVQKCQDLILTGKKAT